MTFVYFGYARSESEDRVSTNLPSKVCAVCGRRFEWRKKLERNWDEVRTCSDACRKRRSKRSREEAKRLESVLLGLLADRPASSTICPSEAARLAFPEGWRDSMERVREVGRRLAHRGIVEIRQGGRRVDPDRARGPIRIARGSSFAQPGAAEPDDVA